MIFKILYMYLNQKEYFHEIFIKKKKLMKYIFRN